MSDRQNDELFSAATEQFPDLEDRIAIFSLTSPNIRLIALNVDPEPPTSDTPPMVGVLVTDSPTSQSLEAMLSQSALALSRFLEAEVLSSEQITNSGGILVGIVTYEFDQSNEIEFLAGEFGKAAMFYRQDALITVTGTGNQALRGEVEPAFDAIFDSIEATGSQH